MGPFYLNEIKDTNLKADTPDMPRMSAEENQMFAMLADVEAAIIRMEERLAKDDKAD